MRPPRGTREIRRIVLILGMHRSGTSLLANLMSELGFNLGTDLMAPDKWNESGYWESRSILAVHEKILKALNLTWDSPNAALPLPTGWMRRPEIQSLRDELIEIVRPEVERTDSVFTVKDPRTAILLPLWNEILNELGLDPVYLLAIRHPTAVAASLKKRNNLSAAHAQLLWLKTNIDALTYAGDKLRAIVDYDLWFRNRQLQVESLLAALDLPRSQMGTISEKLESIVQTRLRHHDESESAACFPLVEKLYAALSRGAATSSIPSEIDEIKRTFAEASEYGSMWRSYISEKESELQVQADEIQGLRRLQNKGDSTFHPHAVAPVTFPALSINGIAQEGLRKRIRICIVSPEFIGPYRNGGIGTACTSLGDALAAAGHDVTLLYTRGRYCEKESIEFWEAHYAKKGITFVPLPEGSQEFDAAAAWYLMGAFRVYEWLRERDFDVVHFTEMMGPGYYCFLAKKQGLDFGKTLLCTGTHSPTMWIREANREFVKQVDDLGLDHIERVSVSSADVVWSPSHYLLNWMRKNNWTLPKSCFVQQYILPYSARSAPAGKTPDEFHQVNEVVFFGRLETRKGLVLFCDALDRLSEDPKMSELKVSFMGRHAEVMGKSSKEFISERAGDWPFRWQIISDFDQPRAISYLQQPGRIAVMASPVDNSPNTVLECLGGRIPFLASRAGGIPELIAAEDEKEICFDWSVGALAQKLKTVYTHGIRIARPAVEIEANENAWVKWHEELFPADQSNSNEDIVPSFSNPLVTICLSHKGDPAFLEETIRSIGYQDYSEIEITLADFGGDASEAVERYKNPESTFMLCSRPIKILQAYGEEDFYPGAAAKASGTYLLFMNTDVILKEGAVATLLNAAETSGADIVSAPVDVFSGASPEGTSPKLKRWLPLGGSLASGLLWNCFGAAGIVVRRDVFLVSGGTDAPPYHGFNMQSFLAKAQIAGAKLEVAPKPLFWFRRSSEDSRMDYQSRESRLRTAWAYEKALPERFKGIPLFAQGLSVSAPEKTENLTKYYQYAVPVMVLMGTARNLVQLRQSEAATKVLLEAVREMKSIDNQPFVLDALMEAARLFIETRNPALALTLLSQAEQIARKLNDIKLATKIMHSFEAISAKLNAPVSNEFSGSR